jgi:hypothetical protein
MIFCATLLIFCATDQFNYQKIQNKKHFINKENFKTSYDFLRH